VDVASRDQVTTMLRSILLCAVLLSTGCASQANLAERVSAGDDAAGHDLVDRHAELWRPKLKELLGGRAFSNPAVPPTTKVSLACTLQGKPAFAQVVLVDSEKACLAWLFAENGDFQALHLLNVPAPTSTALPILSMGESGLLIAQPSESGYTFLEYARDGATLMLCPE
jgi:hypothetical protein